MVRIVTDSVADLPKEYIEKYDITVVPLDVIIEGKTYKDGIDISTDVIYEKIKNGVLPKTSQVTPHDFVEVFDRLSKDGDEVLAVLISSKLSGTYNSALMAKNEMKDRKIEVIDSKSVTLGQGLLVIEAAKMAKDGKSLGEIKEKIEEKAEKIEHLIIFDTLEYVYKGGRISKVQYMLSNVLNLKIIMTLKNGELIVKDKVRGRKKAIKWIIDYINSNNLDLNNKLVGINHANDEEYLKELKSASTERFSPSETVVSHVGCAVATYSGLSAVGIYFERED
ncbi:DegV family protein [Alkalithermobacter paradoxus]|uniref:DegV domain-containing protein n=1 Tax=Alkalithermobacter paradoxus TaxID=29349 RepID=A0A1V4I7B2_9FIRM|nr:DegV domain-containing protein [[Clostridium] thermoalcaliphilum]